MGSAEGLSGPREGERGSAFVQVHFLSLGEGREVREGRAVCGLNRGPLGAETGKEGLRIWSSSSFELGRGPRGEGRRGIVKAQPRASRGRQGGRGLEFDQVLHLSLEEGCEVKEGGAV